MKEKLIAKTMYRDPQKFMLISVHITATTLLSSPCLAVLTVEVLVLLDVVGLQADAEEMEPEFTFVTLHPVNL